jgi:orotate phosphoribosyltransferase
VITPGNRDALIELIRSQALEFGDFVLASGKRASYYLDCRNVTLDARGATLIAEGMLELLSEDMPDAVGGMAIGADPITAAVLCRAGQLGIDLKGFIVRKEMKAHGTGRLVEGPVAPGQTAVILEDVVTTGSSSLQAIERVQQFGLRVSGVLAVIDRLEGAAETFAQHGYRLRTLLSVRDLGIVIQR